MILHLWLSSKMIEEMNQLFRVQKCKDWWYYSSLFDWLNFKFNSFNGKISCGPWASIKLSVAQIFQFVLIHWQLFWQSSNCVSAFALMFTACEMWECVSLLVHIRYFWFGLLVGMLVHLHGHITLDCRELWWTVFTLLRVFFFFLFVFFFPNN